MQPPKPQFLPLTGIRFFLALWVVIFHQADPRGYLGMNLPDFPVLMLCLLRTGYVAVSIFFVLSGFVLSYNYSLLRTWSSSQLVRFSVARFSRLYPAYCLGLVLVSPFVIQRILDDLSAARLASEAVKALLHWMLLQSWIPQTALHWNGPGWSLSDEAFFYCCFPFVGVALWKLARLRSLFIAGLLIWTAALIAPLIAVGQPLAGFGDAPATSLTPDADPFWMNLIKFHPLLRIPDFCIGIVLGRVYYTLNRRSSWLLGRGYWLYVPGFLFGVLAIACADFLPYPLFHNGLLLPLHSLVILGFALGGGILARFLSIQPLIFLGNASYAMYILHIPVYRLINTISHRFASAELGGFAIMAFYLAVVVLLSMAVYKYVEEPLNRILKQRLNGTNRSDR